MGLYSHSRLSTFEQCPLKFKFGYIDKIETEIGESVEAFLGSRVHEALEKLYTDLKFQKLLSCEEVLSFYNKSWEENWNDSINIVRDKYTPENYRLMGEKFIVDYYNKYKPFDQTKTIGLETQKTTEIGEGFRIHIKIDRLALGKDNTYEIHDYKTSNSLPAQEYLDKDRQLAIYAYGVKKIYPDAKNVKLIWHYLAFDKEMSSERTDSELEKLREDTVKLIKKIESTKEFPAKESALCGWCEFRPLCPNFKHEYELKGKGSVEFLDDDGVKLVNDYTKVTEEVKGKEKELEKIREELIEFARYKGVDVVVGSESRAAIKTYPRLSFPKKTDNDRDDFIKTVKDLGLWDQLASVDVYELAKMINNGMIHEDLVKLLEKFIDRGEITKIYLRKK